MEVWDLPVWGPAEIRFLETGIEVDLSSLHFSGVFKSFPLSLLISAVKFKENDLDSFFLTSAVEVDIF